MEVINKLANVRVTPTTDPPSIVYSSYPGGDGGPFRARRREISQGQALPLVSCLMVTRGDRWTIKYALESYRRQTYEKRELIVVVNNENYEAVSELVRSADIENTIIFGVDHDLTLGDCRNVSVARARGQILMQWDDDDLYDPQRIAVAVAVLIKTSAAAALLSRWLVWWPSRGLAAISGSRAWEGSIAVWRKHVPAYPNIARGEDTYVTECIANSHHVSLIDSPLLYVYVVNEGNAFHIDHYEKIIAFSSYVAQDDEYHDLIGMLSERVPISEYLAEMTDRS